MVYQDAIATLQDAEVRVPLALFQARSALDLVHSISIPRYNTSSLENRLADLTNRTNELVSSTNRTGHLLDVMERELASVNETASSLIAESRRLNLQAVELLARAHAAWSLANSSILRGEEFVAMVEQLLRDLQLQLGNTTSFLAGLEQVYT